MVWEPRRGKKPESGPVLRRDANNKLDKDHAQDVTQKLVKKMLTEQRLHEKEMSYNARGNKRDIVVMMGVYIRNSVDGKVVLGEDERQGFEVFDPNDLFKYKTFDVCTVEFGARMLPMNRSRCTDIFARGVSVILNYLIRLGALNG